MALVAVTGMAAEARIARRAGLAAIVIGGAVASRFAAVERAIAGGATALLSFGIAGALDPALPPGTILLPDAVMVPGGEVIPCSAWPAPPSRAITGKIYGGDTIISDARAKQARFKETGAIAVDLESGVVARAAARADIPFFVLRAIADPASRELPAAALIGLREDGRPALTRVLGSVLRQPGQVPALIRLARDTRIALRALASASTTLSVANRPIETS